MSNRNFEREPHQDRRNLGTVDERCTCGATFYSHYNGRCPCSDCGMVHYGKCDDSQIGPAKGT